MLRLVEAERLAIVLVALVASLLVVPIAGSAAFAHEVPPARAGPCGSTGCVYDWAGESALNGAGSSASVVRGYDNYRDSGAATSVSPAYLVAARGGAGLVDEGFGSFSSFKRAMGPAGPGKEWHHVVEQTPGNVGRFGPRSVHNTSNLIPLDVATHRKISGFYSSKQPFTGGQTVRQWLSAQPYEAQAEFGQRTLSRFGPG